MEKKQDKARVNLYIPHAIVEEVDKLSEMYGANRSVMVSFMLKTYIDQQKVVDLARLVPEQDKL